MQQAGELLRIQEDLHESLRDVERIARQDPSEQKRLIASKLTEIILVAQKSQEPEDRGLIIEQLSDLLDDASRLWPDDEKLQDQIFTARVDLDTVAPSALTNRLNEAMKLQLMALSRRFPNSARVHLHRGYFGSSSGSRG